MDNSISNVALFFQILSKDPCGGLLYSDATDIDKMPSSKNNLWTNI